MNTKDQPLQHNGLRANSISTLDAGPLCSIQNPKNNNDCCDKQQPKGSMNKKISEMS
jgi:hypothetical protein